MSFDPTLPFRRSEAVDAGLDPRTIRACVRLHRDALVLPTQELTPRVRALGALLGLDDSAYVSHGTAARLMGIPVPPMPGEHVTVPLSKLRRTRHGVTCHLRTVGVTCVVDGIPASHPHQLFNELAKYIPLVDLVIVGDYMVRHGWATPTSLVRAARPRARSAAAFVRPKVRSPMETRSRMLLMLAGLPEPIINHVIRDDRGEPIREYDLYYEKSRTVIDYDGRHHVEREAQWQRDIGRREAGERAGDRFIVLTARDIFRAPGPTLERVSSALRERGEPGLPRLLDRAWREHFG